MRYTVDWDNCTLQEAERRMNLVRLMFPDNRILLWRSSGGKGFHVEIMGMGTDYERCMLTRRALLDDKKRLKIDGKRWKQNLPINFLFTNKGSGRSELVRVYNKHVA